MQSLVLLLDSLPLDAHGLHHVRYELGVNVCIADLLVQQLTHSALELGRDLLGLVTACREVK
jgi:hypothetical protein